MVRTAEELQQHRSLWKHLQTDTPLKSTEEELKMLRAREVLQFCESMDPKDSGAGDWQEVERRGCSTAGRVMTMTWSPGENSGQR